MSRARLRVVVRLRASGERSARFVAGSIAAHVTLCAVIFVLPSRHAAAPPVIDATVVALAGPIAAKAPAAPPAAKAEAAPEPPRARPEPHPAKEPPLREVPAVKPKPEPKKKPRPEPSAPPASKPETGASEHAEGKPAASPAPAAPTGVTASVGGGDATLGWYSAAVKSALESNWQKPVLEDQPGTFSVTVGFDIARDGTAQNVHVVASSGIASLDRSAIRAVVESSPLPAVPPSWKDALLPATMRFDLTPQAP